MKKQLLVLGGGFAGLWSAIAAARKLAEFRAEAEVEITSTAPPITTSGCGTMRRTLAMSAFP